jgi:hypothetical protein
MAAARPASTFVVPRANRTSALLPQGSLPELGGDLEQAITEQ